MQPNNFAWSFVKGLFSLSVGGVPQKTVSPTVKGSSLLFELPFEHSRRELHLTL